MSHNLANRPQAERASMEIDKARWFVAETWLNKLPHHEVRHRLTQIDDAEEREDMRRRLNAIKERRAPKGRPAP